MTSRFDLNVMKQFERRNRTSIAGLLSTQFEPGPTRHNDLSPDSGANQKTSQRLAYNKDRAREPTPKGLRQ
jgi:hypothetical protein